MLLRVRKKGQVTLPQELRTFWGVREDSELSLIEEGDHAVVSPIKRTSIKEAAGSLGKANKDEIEFAIIEPRRISEYFSKNTGPKIFWHLLGKMPKRTTIVKIIIIIKILGHIDWNPLS